MALSITAFRTTFTSEFNTVLGHKASTSLETAQERKVVMAIFDRVLKDHSTVSRSNYGPLTIAFKRMIEGAVNKDVDEDLSKAKKSRVGTEAPASTATKTITQGMAAIAQRAFANSRPKS